MPGGCGCVTCGASSGGRYGVTAATTQHCESQLNFALGGEGVVLRDKKEKVVYFDLLLYTLFHKSGCL